MSQPPILLVCMSDLGHLQRQLSVVESLTARGRRAYVLTDPRFEAQVKQAGGILIDLYEGRPLEAADATSIPVPSRYVTFAACYLESLVRQLTPLRPALVIYDSFAVVAPLLARSLGVPAVSICSGHAALFERHLARLQVDPRVRTSLACLEAVRRLRDDYGLATASPFSYLDNLSPVLNLYGEPPQFLTDEERVRFEPVAFFGTLAPKVREAACGPGAFADSIDKPRAYMAFGTIIWRYFSEQALAALALIGPELGRRGWEVVISLGGRSSTGPDIAPLLGPGVRVESYVDQWSTLAQADLFVTHHGLNSTHEAIYHRVPMLSYPFFGDQPDLARRCEELGLAIPLGVGPFPPIGMADLERALEQLDREREVMAVRLLKARKWELETIAGRDAIIEQILQLG